MKTTLIVVAAATLALATLRVDAAPDDNQRMMSQQMMQSRQKLDAAQAAQGSDRQKMMQEHMGMMQKTMGEMQKMRPREGMSPAEQKEWMAEQWKAMDSMMGQMADERRLMMQMNCK